MSANHPPRTFSVRRLRWMLNLFPPLFFSRIRIVSLSDDFMDCTVRVRSSLLTRNLQGSMFGGTIFSSADPYYVVMYWQALAHRGIHVQAWLRSATIRYLKPTKTALTLRFLLTEEDIHEALKALEEEGRFVKNHRVKLIDEAGDLCAVAETEVFLRTPRSGQREVSGF
jgi:acyl-coenzyme A thioesterase PaaI-like protein